MGLISETGVEDELVKLVLLEDGTVAMDRIKNRRVNPPPKAKNFFLLTPLPLNIQEGLINPIGTKIKDKRKSNMNTQNMLSFALDYRPGVIKNEELIY